jgi:protein TonB
VPVSIALHVMAIGGAVLASAAMMPPLPAVEEPAISIPIMLPPQPVRAVPVPPAPPKGRPDVAPPKAKTTTTQPAPGPAPILPRADNLVDPSELDPNSDPISFVPGGDPSAPACVGCATGPVGVPNGVTGTDGPVRVHTGVDAPARIHFVKPEYPRVAIMAGLQGDVSIDCVIAPDGSVREARILSGSPLLREAALSAVRQWRYTRPRLNDVPISVLLTVTVHFELRR